MLPMDVEAIKQNPISHTDPNVIYGHGITRRPGGFSLIGLSNDQRYKEP
jgi:hypothetical protein